MFTDEFNLIRRWAVFNQMLSMLFLQCIVLNCLCRSPFVKRRALLFTKWKNKSKKKIKIQSWGQRQEGSRFGGHAKRRRKVCRKIVWIKNVRICEFDKPEHKKPKYIISKPQAYISHCSAGIEYILNN